MIKILILRLLRAIPLLLVVIGIVFLLYRFLPGDEVEATYVLPQKMSGPDSSEYHRLYKIYAHELGLDKPVFFFTLSSKKGFQWTGFDNQYVAKVKKFFQGDFGISYRTRQPVSSALLDALRWTLVINGPALLLIFIPGIWLGMKSARLYGGRTDRIIMQISFLLDAIPTFWLATLAVVFLTTSYYGLKLFPSTGLGEAPYGSGFGFKLIYAVPHLILPIICIVLGSISIVIRQMRSAALEVNKQDYIRTARSKGLDEKQVFKRHIFPNAIFPMITLAGNAFPDLIAGAFLIENIFNIPGMGKLTVESIASRDFPVLFAVIVVTAVFTIAGNIAAELSYRYLDPRIS